MVKIATFVIIIIFVFMCVGASVAGTDTFVHIPNYQVYFSRYLPLGLGDIKQAFIENPIKQVYDLFVDDDMHTYEAALLVVPVFVGACIEFVGNIIEGFTRIVILPVTDMIYVKIDCTPYV